MPESSTGRKVSECGGSWGCRRKGAGGEGSPLLVCSAVAASQGPLVSKRTAAGELQPSGRGGLQVRVRGGRWRLGPRPERNSSRELSPWARIVCRNSPESGGGGLIALPLGFVKSSGGSCGGGGDCLCPLRTSLSPSLCQLVGPVAAGAGASAARRPPPQSASRVTPGTFATLPS